MGSVDGAEVVESGKVMVCFTTRSRVDIGTQSEVDK